MTNNPILRVFGSPYLLLSLGILFWSGNFVVGRWANLDVPPIALSFWRHTFAFLIVAPFMIPLLKNDWPAVRSNLGNIAIMGALLATGNTLVYYAIMYTTVTNAALINAGVPVATVGFSWLILRDVISRRQAIGIFLAFSGIVFVVTKAQLGILLSLEFGLGDLFMLLSVLSWSLYMVMLKRAQIKASPWTILVVLTISGTFWLTPAYGIELALGYRMQWTSLTFASLAYVSFFSTIVSWACVNYGTMRLGPNRASAFMCLHPVFGAILGMIFFNEVLRSYHIVGTLLVLIGIFLVSRAMAAAQSVKT